jgi:hypothetical protein
MSRCFTEVFIDEEGADVHCIHPCHIQLGCSLYPIDVPTYGIGWTCGCAFGGAGYCCDLAVGWDPGQGDWFLVGNGACGGELCSPGACTVRPLAGSYVADCE